VGALRAEGRSREVDSRGFTLWIGGEPQGKDRPRFVKSTGRTFTTKKTELAEGEVRRKWEEAGEPRLPDDTAIRIEVVLYVARPASHWRKDGTLSAQGERQPRPHSKKPDVDNAIKLVMDALNKRAYRDDVRIVEALVERHWADWPTTKIKLIAL
jgi:Holliday junction resolvase RusA-like endonuclease